MSVPHNQARYGELWPRERISTALAAIELVEPYVIVSRGWAWHFMTPVGHIEYKHAHDHKDVDLFVEPEQLATVIGLLQSPVEQSDMADYGQFIEAGYRK